MGTEDKRTLLYRALEKYPAALDIDQVAEALNVNRRTVERLLEGEKPKLAWFAISTDETEKRPLKRVAKSELVAYMEAQHFAVPKG